MNKFLKFLKRCRRFSLNIFHMLEHITQLELPYGVVPELFKGINCRKEADAVCKVVVIVSPKVSQLPYDMSSRRDADDTRKADSEAVFIGANTTHVVVKSRISAATTSVFDCLRNVLMRYQSKGTQKGTFNTKRHFWQFSTQVQRYQLLQR